MELQLGLALSGTPYERREALGFNTSSRPLLKLGPYEDININNNNSGDGSKKSGFDHDVLFDENIIVPKTLPLLLWTNLPNDADNPENLEDNFSSAIFENDGEGLVGWPPVKTWRKKLRRQIPNGGADNHNMTAAAENGFVGRASNSTYVKVKMEGVAIARKIDLSVHRSFETLTNTLMTMFDIFDENRKSFKLTYQDKEGDWLLAEDVPWRTFVGSVKRLKLIRSGGQQIGLRINYQTSSAMFQLP